MQVQALPQSYTGSEFPPSIPTRELQRRWSAVRKAMKAEGIDCLVLQNDNQYIGGYCRYLTDIPTEQAYPWTVVFPQNDEMTLILHGAAAPAPPLPFDWGEPRGVKERINQPYLRTLHYKKQRTRLSSSSRVGETRRSDWSVSARCRVLQAPD